MKRRTSRSVETEVTIEMTPMIDVTFQLLIFFIVTMNFRKLEKKLDSHLPLDLGQNPTAQVLDELVVTVTLAQAPEEDTPPLSRTTRFAIEGREVPRGGLRARLASFLASQPDARLRLDVKQDVPHARVVEVLDVGYELGFTDMGYAGLPRFKTAAARAKWWQQLLR